MRQILANPNLDLRSLAGNGMCHPAVISLPPNQEKEEHDTTEASDPMSPKKSSKIRGSR